MAGATLSGRLLSASSRRPVLEGLSWGVATAARPDFGINLEAVSAGSFAFGLGDRFAVFVSQLVTLSFASGGCDPGDQDGRERTERRRVVVLALDHDESVVALGECRIDVPGVIGCQVEGLAQTSITGLGDALVSGHQSGLVDLGHKAAEAAHTGQVREAVEVARVGQDGRREDGSEPQPEATMPSGSASS